MSGRNRRSTAGKRSLSALDAEFITSDLEEIIPEEEDADFVTPQNFNEVNHNLPQRPQETPEGRRQPRSDEDITNSLREKGFLFGQSISNVDQTLSELEHEHGSPKSIPRSTSTPLDYFQLCFNSDIIDHLVDLTNCYITQNPTHVFVPNLREIDQTDIWNFFSLYMALALVNYARIADAWVTDSDLLGNEFFRSTMSRNKFFTIHRCLQADIDTLTNSFNHSSACYWNLGSRIGIDDQLDKFFGHGKTKYVPKKMARTGIASWEVVDQSLYCYYLIWESTVSADTTRASPFAQTLLNCILPVLPGRHEIYIDAGTLGGIDTAVALQKKGHKFLISCAANCPQWLFGDYLHSKDIQPGDCYVIGRPGLVGLTYQARKGGRGGGKGKKVNFLTNLPGMWVKQRDTVTQSEDSDDEELGEQTQVEKPAAVFRYNKYKGFVDSLKSLLSTFDHEHRSSRLWKHQFFALLRTALHNSFLLWQAHAPRQDRKKYDFLVAFVKSTRTPQRLTQSITPRDTLGTHILVNGHRSRACRVCGKRTTHTCANVTVCHDRDNQPIPMCLTLARHCYVNFHVQ